MFSTARAWPRWPAGWRRQPVDRCSEVLRRNAYAYTNNEIAAPIKRRQVLRQRPD
jgi:hypothetical protein